MDSSSALRELAEVTESQWGMVTSAQATARGVSHVNLARLAESGDLTRLAHGVYKDAGAPSLEHQELRAAWLAIEPKRLAWERLRERPSFATVAGESAAALHGIGDLRAMQSEFITQKRKQSQRGDVRYRERVLERDDVTVREGLPVLTIERTIADLVESRIQLEHVGNALRDASRKTDIDHDRLVAFLSPLAMRNGQRKGDGEALLTAILEAVGIDRESLAKQLSNMPEIGSRIAHAYFSRLTAIDTAAFTEAIRPVIRDLNKKLAPFHRVAGELAERTIQESGVDGLRKQLEEYLSSSPVVKRAESAAADVLNQMDLLPLVRLAENQGPAVEPEDDND